MIMLLSAHYLNDNVECTLNLNDNVVECTLYLNDNVVECTLYLNDNVECTLLE